MIEALSKIPLSLSKEARYELAAAKLLPEIIHTYGDAEIQYPNKVYWITYAPGKINDKGGKISFSRNSQLLTILNTETTAYLENLLKQKIDNTRLHLMRTYGNILPHVDEVRTCAINIGLENSESAITTVNKKPGKFIFIDTEDCLSVRCSVGTPYLLDVSKTHEVTADNPHSIRYMMTYSMRENYHSFIENFYKVCKV
jgi:hypothetical protein